MNKEFDNTNRGVLFRNDKKETDKHPDYTGHINVNGVELWLSAWIKESKSGTKYMSLSCKEKDEAPAPKTEAKPAAKAIDPDDDIPF